MSAVHFAIATIPVAVYFLLIGSLRLRRRPLVTTGWRDTLTLGIAVSGLVAIGPMQLFFPTQAAERFQGWVWLAMFALYVLMLFLIMLSSRPKLIAYGMDSVQFRLAMLEAAQEVDAESSWRGDVLTMPSSGIQLAIEPSGSPRVQQVTSVGNLQSFQDWIRLEHQFVRGSATMRCRRSLAGWPFVLAGGLLLTISVLPLMSDPSEALAQLREFINR